MVVKLGRMYRPIIVVGNKREKMTVAFVDTGADETVITRELAREIGVTLYGTYRSYSATDNLIEGQFAVVTFKDTDLRKKMEVGVSDIPFQSDYSDEEGVEVILGVDFLQDAKISLNFQR